MGRNILVVEDDRNISDLIQMYLVKEGFGVRIAGDGGRAIEEFEKEADAFATETLIPKGESILESVLKCWFARISVGAIKAHCPPFLQIK